MLKSKKMIAIILIAIIAIALFPLETFGAINVTYKDYGEDKTISGKYSYGTLTWTDKTEIVDLVTTTPTTEEQKKIQLKKSKDSWFTGAYEGDTIKFKITNSAIDEDGSLCDAVVTINNVKKFKGKGTTGQIQWWRDFFGLTDSEKRLDIALEIVRGMTVSKNYANQYDDIDCDLVELRLYTDNAQADFSMTYYKAGTDKLASIQGVSSLVYDIDINNQNETSFKDATLKGNEGVIPLNNATIYYNKNDSDARYNFLQEVENGISTGNSMYYGYVGADTKDPKDPFSSGITKATSAMLVENTKANFAMTYSGTNCGIRYVFVSAIPYEIDKPTKSIDVKKITEGTPFHYTISQYVPNNYYTSLIDINGNNKDTSSSLYSKLVVSDELDNSLEIAETSTDKIKITNKAGTDCTEYFTVTKENNKVTATAKADVLKKQDFYNDTYNIVIPVKVKENSLKTVVSNKAKVETTLKDKTTTQESNTVDVLLNYKVTLDVTVKNGTQTMTASNVVTGGSKNTFKVVITPNKGYELTSLVVDGKEQDITNIKYNDDGSYVFEITDENIVTDIDHKVEAICEKKKAKITIKYVDESGKEIAPATEQEVNLYDEYETTSKDINGYELKETPKNAKGTVEEESITVTYVYKQKAVDNTVANTVLPAAGLKVGTTFAFIAMIIVLGIAVKKLNKYKDIK